MDNAMMIGLARQQTLRQAMDISANNIANSSTTGFKAEQVLLETNAATRARHADGPDRLAFVDEWGVGRDFSQGALQGTGRPLDLAIEGEGFFALETEAGERFTRDGRDVRADGATYVLIAALGADAGEGGAWRARGEAGFARAAKAEMARLWRGADEGEKTRGNPPGDDAEAVAGSGVTEAFRRRVDFVVPFPGVKED